MVKTRRVKLRMELKNLASHHGANMARKEMEEGKVSYRCLCRFASLMAGLLLTCLILQKARHTKSSALPDWELKGLSEG